MNATRIETTVQQDGELHLTELPYRKGDRVEAIIMVLPEPVDDVQAKRDQARQRFLARARASTLRSTDRYPSRDELHERH